MRTTELTDLRLSELSQARQAILHEGAHHSPWVSDWISQSWQRCLANGLAPHQSVGFDPIHTAQLRRTLEQHHDLIQSARPELERLSRAIAGTSFFALITDAKGTVIDVGQGANLQDRRVQAIARVGVDLSEAAVGTSAIGTTLHEKKPVWLHRGEHFFKDTSVYSCAGAPLWNGQGDCIGMLDLTAVMSQERPELMHLAALSARSISNAYLLRQPHHLLLRVQWPGRSMGDDNDGMVLLGEDGEILGANALAREWLQLPTHGHPCISDVFATPLGLLMDSAHHQAPMELPLWSGLHLQARCDGQHAWHPLSQPATTGGLQQIQLALIHKAITHAKGNVAQAAKALGISRATLYRKLSRKGHH